MSERNVSYKNDDSCRMGSELFWGGRVTCQLCVASK